MLKECQVDLDRSGFPAAERHAYQGRSKSRNSNNRGEDFGRGGRSSHYSQSSDISASQASSFSKSAKISQFAQGSCNNLLSNHFKFGIRNAGLIYIYKVDFGMLMNNNYDKITAMRELKENLTKIYGLHIGYDTYLFSLELVRDEVNLASIVRGVEHNIKVTFEAQFSLDEQEQSQRRHNDKILQFILTIVKKTLFEQDYKQVGRFPRFFKSDERREIHSESLYMWPGYDCSVKCFNDGIFLNVDTSTKFITKQTVFDKILELRKNRYSISEIKEILVPSDPKRQKLVVMTLYNSKVYLINDITFEMTPRSYEFQWTYENPATKDRQAMKTNLIDYFLKKYKIEITGFEESQPLLVINYKGAQIFLPCSLCHEAQLPKNFTKDGKKMRNLQQYKISDPKERFKRISAIVEKLSQENKFLDSWNIKINANFATIKSKQLYHPKILDNEGQPKDFEDFVKHALTLSKPAVLTDEKLAIVYSSDDFNQANFLFENLEKVSRELGVKLGLPQWVELPSNSSCEDFCIAIESDIDPQFTQIVVVLTKPNFKFPSKKLLDKMGVPSQFVCTETLRRTGSKYSLYRNILRQINAKLKMDLYRLSIPAYKDTMVVGIDIVNEGNRNIIGMTASYTQHQTQYLSKSVLQEADRQNKDQPRLSKDEKEDRTVEKRSLILVEFMREALLNYQEANKGNLPEQIIVYRDGLGGPTMMEKCQFREVQTVVSFFEKYAENYVPKVIYCFLDRNVTHRLFQKCNEDVYNPGPGTVVDTSLVECQGDSLFDFFMIPHKANVSTARPVQFKVVYNTSSLSKDEIETSTYHLCYSYANFAGPIKVPGACMYAHKIAQYAHEYNITPNKKLSLNLHYI